MGYYIVSIFALYHLSQKPTLEQCAKVPTCNLIETMHEKWLQQSCNSMTTLYKATTVDMIQTFMQITNYHSWLKGGSLGEGIDQELLKLKVAMHIGDLKLFEEAMRSYPWVEYLNTKTYALEGGQLFGSTKRKLELPPGSEYKSHPLDKVNYSITCPNTRI